MSVIIEFNQKEKEKFIKSIGKKEYWLNDGTEANCYLIKGDVYKIYNTRYPIIDNTICKNDLDLESFLFPTEIYMCDQKVFAYKTDTYIQENKIEKEKLQNGEFPNLDNIKKALKQLIKDMYVLSKNHIFVDDLAWCNLLFDGNKFYIIDTLRYEHHDTRSVEQIYKENINLLIYECFEPFIYVYHINYRSSSDKQHEVDEKVLNELEELIPYIKETAKQIQKEFKDKEVQKIKRFN